MDGLSCGFALACACLDVSESQVLTDTFLRAAAGDPYSACTRSVCDTHVDAGVNAALLRGPIVS